MTPMFVGRSALAEKRHKNTTFDVIYCSGSKQSDRNMRDVLTQSADAVALRVKSNTGCTLFKQRFELVNETTKHMTGLK